MARRMRKFCHIAPLSSALALPAGTRVRGSNEGAVNFPHPLFLPVTFPPFSAASPIIPPLHFRIGGAPSFEIGLEAVAASHSMHAWHFRSLVERSANRGLNTNV